MRRPAIEDSAVKPRGFKFGEHFDEYASDFEDDKLRPHVLKPGCRRVRVEYPETWGAPTREVLLETVSTFEDPIAGRVAVVLVHRGADR